jgi:hypothetical protein
MQEPPLRRARAAASTREYSECYAAQPGRDGVACSCAQPVPVSCCSARSSGRERWRRGCKQTRRQPVPLLRRLWQGGARSAAPVSAHASRSVQRNTCNMLRLWQGQLAARGTVTPAQILLEARVVKRVRACMRTYERACMRACVSAHVHTCLRVRDKHERVQILAKPEPVRPRPPGFHTSLPAPIHHHLALPSPPPPPADRLADATATAAALGAPVSVPAPASAVRPRSDPRGEAKAEPEGLRFRCTQIVSPVLNPPHLEQCTTAAKCLSPLRCKQKYMSTGTAPEVPNAALLQERRTAGGAKPVRTTLYAMRCGLRCM